MKEFEGIKQFPYNKKICVDYNPVVLYIDEGDGCKPDPIFLSRDLTEDEFNMISNTSDGHLIDYLIDEIRIINDWTEYYARARWE